MAHAVEIGQNGEQAFASFREPAWHNLGTVFTEEKSTREMLEAEFGGFAKIEIRQYETMMSEGGAHAGMGAVIDLIGWK